MANDGPFVGPPYIRSDAARKTRLIGFNASYAKDGYTLKPEHITELNKLADFVSQTTSFSYWIIGFASKAGNHASNQQLSSNRALAVEKYLVSRNKSFADDDRLSVFEALGDDTYRGPAGDNSNDERAVEVHIFIGDVKPVRPPNVRPKPPKPPLPHGPRFTTWSVAAVFGVTVPIPFASAGPAGLQAVFNLFAFKKTDGGEEAHWYASAGLGAAVSLPGLGPFKQLPALWNFLTSASFSGLAFSEPVKAVNPFNFDDLSGADVSMVQAGGGIKPPSLFTPLGGWFIPTGYQFAHMQVSGSIWHYDSVGQPFFSVVDMLHDVDIGGPQSAAGLSAGIQGGALKRLT